MNVTWSNLGWALLWAVVAGVVGWLLLTPIRRRSLAGLMASLVLTGAAASAGALWGAIHSMLVPMWGWSTVVVLTAFSGAVTAVAAWGVAHRLAKDRAVLRSAVADLGAGRIPQDGPRLSAGVEDVRRELRETAAALTATRERERSLESARRELVSWVSHDLRTPLAGLRAMAEALEDGVVDQPELYYKQIGASVERLNQMVEDLFDLSRIQAGAVAGTGSDAGAVALADLVSDVVAGLDALATAQEVRLAASSSGVSGDTVTGSGRELNRALTNLVANAVRHTPAHGAVDVRVERHGGYAEVSVSDECGGIAAEHLPRVFDVGFRGEAARTPRGGDDGGRDHTGAGLGLAITRGIVEAHGGTVDVVNTDVGCRFRMRLPLG